MGQWVYIIEINTWQKYVNVLELNDKANYKTVDQHIYPNESYNYKYFCWYSKISFTDRDISFQPFGRLQIVLLMGYVISIVH